MRVSGRTRDTGSAIEWGLVDETNGALEQLEPTVSVALFRIAQEAINNAVRHAAPLAIMVRLEADKEQLSIEISDDGTGLSKVRGRIGGGIDNMKTRARLISARFTTGPGPNNRGTAVRVVLPLAPNGQADVPN
ncbi:signal transduction histidine kinase [Rhizobium etli]|uniref:Signal transduction histidine kinase n=1 Tax=Rhizobium etli TaxID=29449 RepID=A0A7W6VC45_RHIET|nr:signal transduction histidine kinase [Rhizobium etli]MBB4536454.1 signal transduction histidine kinase [Rhizobium etli]